ncbi:MAG: DUF2095 family protein [Candidatus Bathyarchaeia archaeon]|jgi:hypothetical protein
MATDKKSLKKMFPHLYKELETGDVKVPINAVRKNPQEVEEAEAEEEEFEPTVLPDKLRHFNPCAVDFIRRCDTEAQAEEIIAYLKKKGEITKEYAEELRCQLKREGVRSFGPKKEDNYYFREGGIY